VPSVTSAARLEAYTFRLRPGIRYSSGALARPAAGIQGHLAGDRQVGQADGAATRVAGQPRLVEPMCIRWVSRFLNRLSGGPVRLFVAGWSGLDGVEFAAGPAPPGLERSG